MHVGRFCSLFCIVHQIKTNAAVGMSKCFFRLFKSQKLYFDVVITTALLLACLCARSGVNNFSRRVKLIIKLLSTCNYIIMYNSNIRRFNCIVDYVIFVKSK